MSSGDHHQLGFFKKECAIALPAQSTKNKRLGFGDRKTKAEITTSAPKKIVATKKNVFIISWVSRYRRFRPVLFQCH